MITKKRQIGDKGEKIAIDFLRQKEFLILEKNFLVRSGEIDIIAEKDGIIVFVEVKTRNNENFGHPLESISPSKIRKTKSAAWRFLQQKNWGKREFRFDIVCILREEITHLENAIEG